MTKDEICGLLRQIHDVVAMQSETNFVPQQPTTQEYAMGYAEGFNDACKPKQGEPVAWYHAEDFKTHFTSKPSEDLVKRGYWQPLYTIPPQRPWVGLTNEEISARSKGHMTRNGFARNIEQALKEKNT